MGLSSVWENDPQSIEGKGIHREEGKTFDSIIGAVDVSCHLVMELGKSHDRVLVTSRETRQVSRTDLA